MVVPTDTLASAPQTESLTGEKKRQKSVQVKVRIELGSREPRAPRGVWSGWDTEWSLTCSGDTFDFNELGILFAHGNRTRVDEALTKLTERETTGYEPSGILPGFPDTG